MSQKKQLGEDTCFPELAHGPSLTRFDEPRRFPYRVTSMNGYRTLFFLLLAISLCSGCATVTTDQVELNQKNCSGPMLNNLREGQWICKNSVGNTTIEAAYAAGRKHGLVRLWRADGSLDSESHWQNGKLDGRLTNYFPNGNKFLETTYKQQKPDGAMTEWFENGNKKSELSYSEGTLNGWVREWTENGVLNSEEKYQNGQPVANEPK